MNNARLEVASGPLVAPVLSRVIGMLAARAQCPVDRLDDALLVADAIAAHAPDHTTGGTVALEISADDDSLTMTVVAVADPQALLAAADLPGVGNVLERIADSVSVEDDRLVVRMAFVA